MPVGLALIVACLCPLIADCAMPIGLVLINYMLIFLQTLIADSANFFGIDRLFACVHVDIDS